MYAYGIVIQLLEIMHQQKPRDVKHIAGLKLLYQSYTRPRLRRGDLRGFVLIQKSRELRAAARLL